MRHPTNIPVNVLPDAFGNYFQKKVLDIRKKLDESTQTIPQFELFTGSFSSKFEPVTPTFVKSVIKSSPLKSCSLDPIPTSLLLTHLDCLIDPITTIINESLSTGIVPMAFKTAVVIPNLKKQSLSPEDFKNFRPVSNLPFLSKILEKVVLAQLKEHLVRNDLNEVNQSAYKEFHNTETALLKIQNDLLLEADKGNISILALLDLSAAFDTIDHHILIDRLSKNSVNRAPFYVGLGHIS